jgi:peptidoglycan/xylan/chitin deacetylase (PgdA/CDA1 family)
LKGVCGPGGIASLAGCLASERREDDADSIDESNETDDEGQTNESQTDEDESVEQPTDDDEGDPTPPSFPDGGAVVFVYDDGPMEDYTQAFPAHQAFDAPATTGIVSEWIGLEAFMDNDWMDVDHLETLVDAGWEIASHTTAHTSLASFELVESADITPGIRTLGRASSNGSPATAFGVRYRLGK